MSPCAQCDIEEKIYVCCGRYPVDGTRKALSIGGGRVVMTCPHFDPSGGCRIYDQRPMDCRKFFCSRFDRQPEEDTRRFEWIAAVLKSRPD